MRNLSNSVIAPAFLGLSLILGGCATDPYTGEQKVSNTAKGAGIGAVTGAILGAAVSSDKDREKGAWQGAVAGAAVGGGYGYYMDQQEARLRQQLEATGVRVQRIGDTIRLIMPGNVTFDVNQANIKPQFTSVLDSVVAVVREYDKTVLDVKGYTDSTGSFEHNQQLSERRAQSVANFFVSRNIPAGRLRTTGFGPRNPIASNDTAAGREQNRRVELDLLPIQGATVK